MEGKEEKRYRSLISYSKYITLFMGAYCFLSMFILSFDPSGWLETELVKDMTGVGEMTAETRSIFEFMFLLFGLLSVITFGLQYMIIVKVLPCKEQWGINALLALIILWVTGATGIAVYSNAVSYFYSILGMAFLFMPPFIMLKISHRKLIKKQVS